MKTISLLRSLTFFSSLLLLQTALALPNNNGGDNIPDPPEDPRPAAPTITPSRMDNDKLLFGVNGFTVKWKDASWNETGFRIYRMREGETAWTKIKTLNAIDGSSNFRSFVDNNVNWDTRYCYKIEAYNDKGRRESSPRCAKTSIQGINPPVVRAQLRVDVGDHGGGHEGTNNVLGVGLPGFTWIYPAHAEGTTLADIFQGAVIRKGSSRMYDLNFYKVKYVGDLQDFNLSISGEDDICIKKLALYINGVELFNHPMRDADSDCKHFRGTNDIFSVIYTVPRQDMRGSPGWANVRSNVYVKPTEHNAGISDFDNRFPWRSWVFRDELETRLEGYVGHFLKDNELYWDSDNGRRNIELSVLDFQNAIFGVDFDFKVDTGDYLPHPWVDVDFKLDYDLECVAGPSGQTMPFGPDSVLRLKARMFDFHKDIPLWAELAPKAFFWAWMAYDFFSGEQINSFGSYWNPDDVAMKEFMEDYADDFTQQFDIPHLCNGLNAPPVGIDIVTDSSELVPWQGTEAEPFPDGDMPGNFALKIWGDREDLQAIMQAYFRCNPIFGGSDQKCVSTRVFPTDVATNVDMVLETDNTTGDGVVGGTVGGVIVNTDAVLQPVKTFDSGTKTVSDTLSTGTVLNKATLLNETRLLNEGATLNKR